jgi:hypothetical protein
MRLRLPIILLLASLVLGTAQAADDGQNVADAVPARPTLRHAAAAGSGLDARIRTLSKFLDLDAAQQSELRKVLENQREQVRKLWNDSTVPPANRINATKVISDNTADQIRALLNEEQRKKYNPPRQPHQAGADADKRSVEDWMNATRQKQAEPTADHD